MFVLYILKCSDDKLYIGHTDNLDERLKQHDLGKANSFTAQRRPLTLIHTEEFETRYDALCMERKLKGWTRAKKLAYIKRDWVEMGRLAKGKHEHERLSSHASTL